MTELTDSARLKLKRDTFYFPDSNSSVYFRNNMSSFSLKGGSIVQWVEKLLPLFDGRISLGELTEGFPQQYKQRVFDIGNVLYQHGFLRDVSQDLHSTLNTNILKKYASQIEFIENFVDSAAFRFQKYVQEKTIVIGSGSFFVSLISALLDSGKSKFHMLMTRPSDADRDRVRELIRNAAKDEPELNVEEASFQKKIKEEMDWRETVKEFDWIVYVSPHGNIEELTTVHAACRQENKVFIPAVCFQDIGMAGPLVHPDSDGCWESAWRRLNRNILIKKEQTPLASSIAHSMLANVIVFELFKKATGVTQSEERNQFFLLNFETLEGEWHRFLPHPLADTGFNEVSFIDDLALKLTEESETRESMDDLLDYFSMLTSTTSGIFHAWEEGDLRQLPLAQCCVQVVDPVSRGPAELLPSSVHSGLTHEEAQREAGLSGIETYVSTIKDFFMMNTGDRNDPFSRFDSQEFVGVGAGETLAEGVCRGLEKNLEAQLSQEMLNGQGETLTEVYLRDVRDEHCLFFLQSLRTMYGEPRIGLGNKVCGFPLVWVGTNDQWFCGVGLNLTMALRKTLQKALMQFQNPAALRERNVPKGPPAISESRLEVWLDIPSAKDFSPENVLLSAIKILKQNHLRLVSLDLSIEPFLKEKLAGVYGVVLLKEESL